MFCRMRFFGVVFVGFCLAVGHFAVAETEQNTPQQDIVSDQDKNELNDTLQTMQDLGWDSSDDPERQELYKKIEELSNEVQDLTQQNYQDAKEREQSFANRMLGGLTIAATGIGGMQLAQGIAEKKADDAANADMRAYVESMSCTYGDGKTVKFGTEPVELPGANVPELMQYRTEYIALAADLKERKEALGLKPGIEAEEILDKATMGLYDDENTGITGGHYASRYRAAAGNEEDEKGLKADKKEAKNRMIAGGVIAGAGLIGGIVGNAIINKDQGKTQDKLNKTKAELAEYMRKAIAKCNDLITENKNTLQEQVRQHPELMQQDIIKEHINAIQQLELLPSDATINQLKEHPLCR